MCLSLGGRALEKQQAQHRPSLLQTSCLGVRRRWCTRGSTLHSVHSGPCIAPRQTSLDHLGGASEPIAAR